MLIYSEEWLALKRAVWTTTEGRVSVGLAAEAV